MGASPGHLLSKATVCELPQPNCMTLVRPLVLAPSTRRPLSGWDSIPARSGLFWKCLDPSLRSAARICLQRACSERTRSDIACSKNELMPSFPRLAAVAFVHITNISERQNVFYFDFFHLLELWFSRWMSPHCRYCSHPPSLSNNASTSRSDAQTTAGGMPI